MASIAEPQTVVEHLLNAVTAKLTAGDVKSATVAYDTAVRSSEGT